jgi:hypothetical protein
MLQKSTGFRAHNALLAFRHLSCNFGVHATLGLRHRLAGTIAQRWRPAVSHLHHGNIHFLAMRGVKRSGFAGMGFPVTWAMDLAIPKKQFPGTVTAGIHLAGQNFVQFRSDGLSHPGPFQGCLIHQRRIPYDSLIG